MGIPLLLNSGRAHLPIHLPRSTHHESVVNEHSFTKPLDPSAMVVQVAWLARQFPTCEKYFESRFVENGNPEIFGLGHL